MTTRAFAITADDKPLVLKPDGTGEITVSVTNTTTRAIRGLAKLVPLGATKHEWIENKWLKMLGEVERNFSPTEAHQFVVRMEAPKGTPPGKYSCRLNMMSVQNREEDYAEGPQMDFEITKEIPDETKKGPKTKWLFWVLLGVFLIGGTVAALILMKKPRLHAAFAQSATRGFAPLTVQFTNLTAGKIGETMWNFGDGAIATNRNSEHTFAQPGTYVVTLLVAEGKRQGYATMTITVLQRASARFQASPNGGAAPLAVRFVNQSTGDDLTWQWDLGNGKTSTDPEPPAQTYGVGTHTVRLVATGPQVEGQVNTSTNTAVVRVAPPSQVSFKAAPQEGEAPLDVKFTDTSRGNPTSWRWTFGDGSSSREQSPIHTYRSARNYDVTLEINGPGGPATAPPRSSFIVVRERIRTVPKVIGMTETDARKAIQGAGLTVGKVTVTSLGGFGAFGGFGSGGRKVWSQQPVAGTRLRAGEKVNIEMLQ